MAESSQHLRALASFAKDSRRALEATVSQADETWNDDARHSFEAEHLAHIRSDARRLGVELEAIVALADEARNALEQD